ncbi:MAG: NAD(P)/FAD-dependent oxidoreductase [Chloroflexi bacterium]|nr:NAD(P)/FAD-dependent oxidoreductase [Chloroflexota bacterium]
MDSSSVDVAIVGAGPYGLSLATHLGKRGIEHRIFGPPMHAWRSMSPGMYLKSLGFATSIQTPHPHHTLPEYCRDRGLEDYEPIEIATFAQYGVWVQQRLVPHVEETTVTGLKRVDGRFALTLETGEQVSARRVVVASGLTHFERIPTVFAGLPRGLATHTAQHGDFTPFAGADVTVIGAGQSALQAAALLHEHGASVRMVVRQDVSWGGRGPREAERSLLERVRVPISVLGHGRDNWVLQHIPMLMHYLPTERRLRFTHTHLGPGGAWWLRDRVEGKFPIHTNTSVRAATVKDGKVCLRVHEDGIGEREVLTDRVMAGTGYEVDVDKMEFIDPDLAKEIRRTERAPRLSRHFESSVPGLYFIGPAAALSFGPLFRFVAGAAYAVPTVARHLARSSGPLSLPRPRTTSIRGVAPLSSSPESVAAQTEPGR